MLSEHLIYTIQPFTSFPFLAVSKADIEVIKIDEGLAYINMCVPSKARGKCGSFVLSRDDSPSEQEVRTMDAGINSELCEDSSKFENLIKPDVESKF